MHVENNTGPQWTLIPMVPQAETLLNRQLIAEAHVHEHLHVHSIGWKIPLAEFVQ